MNSQGHHRARATERAVLAWKTRKAAGGGVRVPRENAKMVDIWRWCHCLLTLWLQLQLWRRRRRRRQLCMHGLLPLLVRWGLLRMRLLLCHWLGTWVA